MGIERTWQLMPVDGLKRCLAICIGLAITLFAGTVLASGGLDTSFGSGGLVTTDFVTLGVSQVDETHAVAIQGDGKIVAVGTSAQANPAASGSTMSPFNFAVARYNADGSPDLGFGSDGQVRTAFVNSVRYSNAQSVVVQNDGKIVVGGDTYNDSTNGNVFALVRYNPDGSLDSGFGSGGMTITSFVATASCAGTSHDYGRSVALDGNGKIVFAGYSYCATNNNATVTYTFDVARYNTDGSLDNTFGASGRVATAPDSGVDGTGFSVVVQVDGKIVVGGEAFTQSAYPWPSDMALMRYNSDGSLDSGFGDGGTVITSSDVSGVHVNTGVGSIALQVDGKIVVGGGQLLARYDNDGTLDAGFGNGGKLLNAFDSGLAYSYLASVAVQGDGKIIGAGNAGDTHSGMALARYNSDGSVDVTFGSAGWAITPASSPYDDWFGTAVALQSDGRIVLAGYKYYRDFVVARYLGTDCGNGAVEPGESCDDGNTINGDGCDNNCTVTACGNGIPTAGEDCDDGDTTGGDGCSATCQIEICFNCAGTPSVCSPKCVADQCHVGVCDPGTGTCSYPNKPNGAACDDGDGCPADTCQAGGCQPVSCPSVDAVVLPGRPLNVKIAPRKISVDKTLTITVRNADPADRTISLSVDGSNCPMGVAGIPDFNPKTPTADTSILVPAGETKKAKLPLIINSVDFDSFNFKAPARCTLVLTASAVVAGGSNDPTPDNNIAVIELNVVDSHDLEQTTTHETTIKSANPTTINIESGKGSATKTLNAVIGNADYKPTAEAPGDPITLSANTTCSGLSLGAPICDATTSSSTVAVKGGKSKTCKITATADGSQISTSNQNSPQRCAVTLTATGPTSPQVSPLDGGNNSTELVIDVLDKND